MSAPGETGTKTEQLPYCPVGCMPAEDDRGNCPLLMSAYILAGLAMMLNIRLSYSSAPYALIRFQLPENLFSVFVRRMASSLELWCLPGFIIADAIELAIKLTIGPDFSNFNTLASKELKFNWIIGPSIVAQWLNFLTYVILLIVYLIGDDQGHLTTFYWTIAVSGFVFGINNVFVFAADYNYIPIYIAGENCFPALTSFIHYITTLIFGNRRKYDSDFIIVYIDILVATIISFVAAIVWTAAYGVCTSSGPFDGTITYTTPKSIKSIIITGITTTTANTKATESETTENIAGTVTITYGTVKYNTNGTAYITKDTQNAAKRAELGTATKATITPNEHKGPTLTIEIAISKPGEHENNALDALADLAIPVKGCKVEVTKNKLTIKITYAKDDKYAVGKFIDIEITGITGTLAAALQKLGTDATVKAAPAPNHLTIKYKDGSVEKTAAHPKTASKIPEGTQAQSMIQITDAIAKEIIATAKDKTYYNIPYNNKIRYYFTLTTTEANKLATGAEAKIIVQYGHIFAEGFGSLKDINPEIVSPLLIVLVGMGLVYAIYPGIAPGMIVPFYLIDKIEMVLLIATIFPPVIIAILRKHAPDYSPQTKVLPKLGWKFPGWKKYEDDDGTTVHAQLWHLFDLLIVTMIILAYIFIYSLHYRESNISRSIVNQPKMSTTLTIIFYMCHEISLAVGFPGMVANGAEYTVLAQMIGAFLMVFLALYSEGYIIEYKSHDPAH